MSIPHNKVRARIDLDSIRHNYLFLRQRGGNPYPVIKADAYGHGLERVAATLAEAGAKAACVGSPAEALALRESGWEGRIVALLGPLDAEDYGCLAEASAVAMIHRFDQLAALAERAGSKPLPVALKFDTGMGRLGFGQKDLIKLAAVLADNRSRLDLVMAVSHLATADDPDQAFLEQQMTRFADACAELRRAGFAFEASLGNSAGLLARSDTRLDIQRPGIALYGGNPFHGTSLEELGSGLRQAMHVSAPVLQVHDLAKGESVSYSRTFTAPNSMRVAIVAAGYADAYSRVLSGRGAEVCLKGSRARVLGRVCMQLTAVDATRIGGVVPGERAWLLGGEGEGFVPANELAGWWGTNSYEVFCVLGLNRREYTDAGV